MPDGGSRRQSDKPTTEEVTQKSGKLKFSDQVPVFETQTFPNGAQRESWSATKVDNWVDVRAGCLCFVKRPRKFTVTCLHVMSLIGLLSPDFVDSCILSGWKI